MEVLRWFSSRATTGSGRASRSFFGCSPAWLKLPLDTLQPEKPIVVVTLSENSQHDLVEVAWSGVTGPTIQPFAMV